MKESPMHIEDRDFQELMNTIKELTGEVAALLGKLQAKTGGSQEMVPEGVSFAEQAVENSAQTYARSGTPRPGEAAAGLLNNFQERYSGVFALYEQGFSIDEIARKMNLDKGEVQLIFNISRKL